MCNDVYGAFVKSYAREILELMLGYERMMCTCPCTLMFGLISVVCTFVWFAVCLSVMMKNYMFILAC